MLRFILLSLFLAGTLVGTSQVNIKDSSITISIIDIHAGAYMPSGNLADRFGNNGTVGAGFTLKLKSNLLLGASYSFIYGKDVKNKDDYFKSLRTSSGWVIDANGQYAELFFYQRGFNANFQLGYQFNILNLNPNSGPFFTLSPGLMQHYVRIENPDNVTPQISGDYLKGYDRLTNGFSLTGFLGYRFLSNSRLYNFYVGVEMTQAWTQSRRSYNFDDMARDTQKRTDIMYGIKVGWMIPLYGRVPDDYYYF